MSYGKDLSCGDRLSTGRMVGGATLLAQACYRRLITPRGKLSGDALESSYGFCVADYIGSVGGALAAAALPAMIENELLKDDRVARVRVSVARATRAGADYLTISARVTPADEGESFSLTMTATEFALTLTGAP